MPPLNEGAFLYMPTALPGLSVTDAQRILQIQDRIIKNFPEVERVFGKAGRVDSPTDPAPFSMVETTIGLKPNARFAVPGVTAAFRDEMATNFGSGFDVTATGDYQTTRTKGNEVAAIANLTRNWRLSASYSDNDVANVDRVPILKEFQAEGKALNKPTPLLNDLISTVPEGVPTGGFTKARGNLVSRYVFSQGTLKGFAIGGGANWRLRTYRGAVNLTGAAGAASTNLYSPAYTLYNAFFSYNRKVLNRNTTFQLNVDNLFDKDYYRSAAIGSASWGDPRSYRFSMSVDL